MFDQNSCCTTDLLCIAAPQCKSASTTYPIGVNELASRPVHPFVAVRTEIVALSLQQVCREPVAPVSVVKGQRCRKRRHWNACESSRRHGFSPSVLGLGKRVAEIAVNNKRR